MMIKENKTTDPLYKLVVIDTLEVGPVKLESDRITTTYKVWKNDSVASYDFIYKYDEKVFDPVDNADLNLASILGSQVAINYGLFCKKIIFNGLFDSIDKSAIKEWVENTAKEIYVKKFLEPNSFLIGDGKNIPVVKKKKYSAADVEFVDSDTDPVTVKWEFWEINKNKYCVLSSGGKDSLLSYGLLNELGYEVHPIFGNESGRHWFTAINSYKYFKDKLDNTSRVWINSDRLFSFMLKQLPFIRPDYADVRADEYPIRLWTVAIFSLAAVPLIKKRKIGHLVIGDEYDTSIKASYKGITHFDGLYDQSRYFDEYMSRYFMRKGWAFSQFSILRPLSELLIETILAKRYPELQANQVSCHSTHKENDKIKPCGKCEKCRRIVGMLSAIGVNPEKCGYSKKQIIDCLQLISEKKIHQEKEGAEHLLLTLNEKGLITLDDRSREELKYHPEILNLRFDNEKSTINSIPQDLRINLYKIYLEYAHGAVRKISKNWIEFDLLNDPELKTLYPFEFKGKKKKSIQLHKFIQNKKKKYIWAQLTWPEAEEVLKNSDTVLLPVGAIEQHGPHLPLDVDAVDAEYLAKKVAEACSEPKPLVLPLISYGVSYHHEDFKGTISISNETLAKMVYEIGMDVARQGIKKIVIINGHGDNSPTLNYAAQMINRDAKIFVAVDTGETSDVDLDELISTPNDVHAGEIETSTTLAIRPELVDMDKAKKEVLRFPSRYLNYSSLRGLPWYSHTKKISKSGVMGNPTKADAVKGAQMWEIMIAHLVSFVEDLKLIDINKIHQKKY